LYILGHFASLRYKENLMQDLIHHLRVLSVLIALSLQAACTHMKFTEVWIDENHSAHPYRNVLVIGIADTRGNREDFETYFVNQLNAAGVDALASIKILPDTTKIDRESVLAAIDGLGIDSAIVTHMTSIKEEEYVIPSRRIGVVYGHGYGPGYYNYSMYDYYPYVSHYVTLPGYYNTHHTVSLETNLYDISNEKLVWSGKSAQFAPESVDDVIVQLTQLIISDLKKKQLLQ
jgi:hypothetical protein